MDFAIQHSVVAQLTGRPRTVEVGPFVVGWDPTTQGRAVNYATPRPGAAITGPDVARLVATFRDIDRIPRLEYVINCAPDLEERLLAAGFTVEARHDYLVCSPGALVVPPVPDGFELAAPATDEERAGVVAAQNEAFGGEPVATAADVARMRRMQDAGGTVVLARTADGEVAGGGQASALGAGVGVSELAGIAVRPGYRRRGLAAALTAAITGRVFAAGGDAAWLEASGPDSWRVYQGVGYVPTGKRLYIALD